MRHFTLFVLGLFLVASCGSSSSKQRQHGTMSTLTAAPGPNAELCSHRVPEASCTRHHPELVAKFKKAGDWCVEHDVAESQCFICHPDLSYEPLPELPADADLKTISQGGEDVPSLEAHVVAGKVTVFDFYADWCVPCRKIDAHMFAKLQARKDVALRKLNVVAWDRPLARRYLAETESLPHVIVYGKDGKLVRAITGLDLAGLDAAIEEGAAR